jgi:hypothetical protein
LGGGVNFGKKNKRKEIIKKTRVYQDFLRNVRNIWLPPKKEENKGQLNVCMLYSSSLRA